MEITLHNYQICSPNFQQAIALVSPVKLPQASSETLADIIEFWEKRLKRYQSSLNKIMEAAGAIKKADGTYRLETEKECPLIDKVMSEIEELDNLVFKITIAAPLILPKDREFPPQVYKELRPFMESRESTIKEL